MDVSTLSGYKELSIEYPKLTKTDGPLISSKYCHKTNNLKEVHKTLEWDLEKTDRPALRDR
jgi:hypothetical protein